MPERPNIYWEEFGRGIYCWTLQTYLHLKASGFPCQLVGSLPNEGIVLAHRDSFPYSLRPGAKVLMVCMKADQNPHPYAQLHLVQNPQEVLLLRDSYHIPLWPQPGLIPRDPARGDRFETIAYFGLTFNMAKEFKDPSWQKQLEALGLHWQVVRRDRWYDYSDVDAVIAVRSFSRQDYTWKPATKLYNAWHAGVPAFVGGDSAFRAEYKSELDYIEVNSVDELIVALKCLRDDPARRQAMAENGRVRAMETKPEQLVARWSNFLTEVAVPTYEQWCKASKWSKQTFLQRRSWAIRMNSITQRLRSLILPLQKGADSQ